MIVAQIIIDAKAAQVPKDIIARNIEKASASNVGEYKNSIFEFYGHGGVGFLVNVLTDNDNRASQDISLVAKKNGLRAAATNSVKFKYDYKARLDLGAVITEDELMELCLDHNIDDYILHLEADGNLLSPPEAGKSTVLVSMNDMSALRDALRAKNIPVETSIAAVPKEGFVSISDEDFEKTMAAIDAFGALDDVDSVEHNIELKGEGEEE